MSRHGSKPKVRCAVSTRKSSEEGLEQEFNSLDAQRAAGEAYVASQSHEGWLLIPDRYDDGGISGATLERPALKRLLADIETGRIDCVVVYKVDRLSRSLTDFAKLVDVFERHGVSFVSVTQHFCTTTSMGRLTLNILLSFAQFEREVIGERIRDKFAASRAKGLWMGGRPPLGYDVRDRKLVVNPAEAYLVRLIFRRFLDLGSALLLIRELNAQGYRTKSWTTQAGSFREGRSFDKGTLYKTLRNRTYLGEAVHKGRRYPGEHEPIIDRATWDRVHEVLASNAVRRGNEARARTPAPLRGLIRCTHCSAAMTPTHTRRRGRLYRYYVCLGASRRGHDTCPVRSIAASEVEGLVLGQVRRLLASPELVARTITAVRRENGAPEDTELEEGDIIEALGALEPVWDELYPAEQARIMRLLIERIDVAPDGISVTLHAAGIRSLVAELADQEAPTWRLPSPCWRSQSNDRARGSRTRYPDDPHPDPAAASGWPEADHDTGWCDGTGSESEPRRDAGQGARARAPMAPEDRERSGQVDHRPCGAGGRHGRLCLPAPAAHLPGARHCGSDPGRPAAEGAQVG
jgi:site-specific DNA recombinase